MSGFATRSILVAALMAVTAVSDGSEENPRQTALVRAVQLCREATVNIHTEKLSEESAEPRFFGAKPRRVSGMGTGIVVDERGYIVTNYHVIQNVEEMTVTLHDGGTFAARPVSFDKARDLAVIHINVERPLKVMPLGTSSDVMLAEPVFAVGNAFGYEHTVTAGIVSALHRDVEAEGAQRYENLIQTDASINPGNSGGPLLNLNGEVIGINVAIRANAQRIGFAIPIDDARRTIARLLSTAELNGHPHGVSGTDVKSPGVSEFRVEAVDAGSPADAGGMRAGDVVVRVRDIDVHDCADFERALLDLPTGREVDMVVRRGDDDVVLHYRVGGMNPSVTVAAAGSASPATSARTASVSAGSTSGSVVMPERGRTESERPPVTRAQSESGVDRANRLFGVMLTPLGPADGRRLDRRFNGGMKISTVRPGSLADVHGIRSGDILLGLDNIETLNAANLDFILQDNRVSALESIGFMIHRQGAGPLMGAMDLKSLRKSL